MTFFNKLFNSHKPAIKDPVFPGESYSILRLNFPEGWGLATINKCYDNYHNKAYYGWHVLIELEVLNPNENGHPIDEESAILNSIEERLTTFLSRINTVHHIGRVTRKNMRDVLYYIDNPKLDQREVNELCDDIMKERGINLTIQYDPTWKLVGGFVK